MEISVSQTWRRIRPSKTRASDPRFLAHHRYDEARQTFKDILQIDSNCALAHWGIAMSYWHPMGYLPTDDDLIAGQAAVAQALSLYNSVTARERLYISAASAFFTNWNGTSHENRVSAYESELKKLYRSYGIEDREGSLFYALAVIGRAATFGNQAKVEYKDLRRAGNIIELVLFDYPSMCFCSKRYQAVIKHS
jgi:hypothetical protein